MVALRSRRVYVTSHCPVCRNAPEDTIHALVKCYQAKQVWRLTPVGDISSVVHSFVDWWRQILKKQNMDVVVQVAMTLWSIWKGRNDLIWKGIVSKTNQIIYNAGNFLAQWQYAKLKDQTMGTSVEIEPCFKWSKPVQGWLKCNVDAAVFKADNSIGFGCIIRDERGAMIAARNGMMGGSSDPLLAEALSCKEALSWIKELNLNKVIVETDSLMLAQAFNVSADNFSYFGSILGDCQILAKDLIDVNLV